MREIMFESWNGAYDHMEDLFVSVPSRRVA